MRQALYALCGLILAASSCYRLGTPTSTPVPIGTIVAGTAHAALTQTAAAAPPTPTAFVCADSAALVQQAAEAADVNMPTGSAFTQTWQLRNTGNCDWHDYSIIFVSGDRMGAPDTVAVKDTAAGGTVDVSVDLTAPTAGSYTALFALRDGAGKVLSVDQQESLAIKIVIPEAATATPAAIPVGTVTVPKPPADCKYVPSAVYEGDIVRMINQERTNKGLPALTVNAHLRASAWGHSIDMACNNYFEHELAGRPRIHDRIVAAGYPSNLSMSEEMIYCGGLPDEAFTWWMGDKDHHDVIVDVRVTEIGVGYVFLPHSPCGSYFTVDLAKP